MDTPQANSVRGMIVDKSHLFAITEHQGLKRIDLATKKEQTIDKLTAKEIFYQVNYIVHV